MSTHYSAHLWKSTHVKCPDGQVKISPTAKLLLVYLADNCNPEGITYRIGSARMCKQTGLSERTVRRTLSRYHEIGAVIRHRHVEANLNDKNTYQINLAAFVWGHSNPRAGATVALHRRATLTPEGRATVAGQKQQVLKYKNKQQQEAAAAAPVTSQLAQSLNGAGIEITGTAIPALWQKCQAAASDVTAAEIAQLARARLERTQLGKIKNLAGFLIRVLPAELEAGALKPIREQAALETQRTVEAHEQEARNNAAINAAHEAARARMSAAEDAERDALFEAVTEYVTAWRAKHPGTHQPDLKREVRRRVERTLFERELDRRL